MRKKLFTFLLALVTSVGLSWATVITWDQSKVSSMAMNVSSGSDSKTSDGITVTAVSTGEFVLFGYDGAIEIGNGEGSGGGYLTFTSSVGNIAQIDINHSGAGEWSNANGDWISPYYENFDGGIFTWSGTPAASVTLTGDAPRHIENITSIEFTIEDGGGSEPATGLQVVEVTSDIYNGWNSNSNPFSVNALPGFQAVTFDEAKEWTEVPTSGTAVLVYRTNGDNARVIQFFDGTISDDYDIETDFNQIYENIKIFGNRFFYTAGGGSTPTPATNPSGECGAQGDNLLWELNTSTGVLTITGSGAMNDWPDDTNLPWYDNRLDITSVVLPSGITSLGTKAFRGCNNLASINMTENYPAGLTAINQEAFCNTKLTSVTIPESVVTIGQDAFYLSQAITDVYCYADPNNLTWTDFYCDDFNKTPAKSTQCHVKDCYLAVYNSKWNTSSQSTDVNVTFVGDLPGDCGAPAPTPTPSGDKLPGVFSVSADKAVCFSKGNLQYNSGTQAWQFAENQWDYIGNAAGNKAITVDGIPDNSGIVDLFGWVGASSSWITGSTQQYGISTSTTNNDYGNVYGEALKQDWGNTMGSDWRTLSKDEWNYLLTERANAANLRTLATVNDKTGLILMPDGWTASGVSLTVTKENYTDNTIGSSDWATLAGQGCVFLPAAGSRNGNWVMSAGTKGHYWSSTSRPDGASLNSFKLVFMADDVDPTDYTNRYTGLSVRLVSETAPTPTPTPTPSDEQVPTNEDPENPSYHYSTFFHSTQNYKLTNDGTQAFIADLSNNDLVLTEIANGTQVIPANTAVILRKTGSADPVVLTPTEENGVSVNPDDNSLEGVDAITAVTSIDGLTTTNCYVLSGTNEYGVGFYRINSDNLKAHKAYVKYAGLQTNAPRRMRFVFNQEQVATGVENVQGDKVQSTKVLRDGQLVIIRNGVEYNAAGQMIK